MADQPSLDSIPGSFAGLKAQFRPDKAAGVDKTIQFDFTGREPGSWTLIVRNGALEYQEGAATSPNTTVTVDSDTWLKILRREMDATMAFMTGKLKIAGDMGVMLQFQGWFDQPQ
jgi:putative sterol carrier protein